MKQLFVRFMKEEEGQDLIEYALLAALIAVVAYGAISAVGSTVNGKFSTVNTQLNSGS